MTTKQTDLEYWRERAIDLDDQAIHLRAENERLKRLYDDVYAENQRLLLDNAELSTECDQYQAKLTEVWAEVARLRAAKQD